MFDPRQQQQRRPMAPPWAQQLGQGLAAQPGPWNGQGAPQGAPMGPPPGVRFAPGGGDGPPPPAAGPDGRPIVPPGGGFLRDQDAAIRAALMRRHQPVAPQGAVAGPAGGPPVPAAEPDADERGGPPDGDQDDPRTRGPMSAPMRGMGAYR
jgi:hypothetical protein